MRFFVCSLARHGNALYIFEVLFGSVIILFILFFSSSSSFAEYETAIGYLDVKTSSLGAVSFYLQRNSTFASAGTVIPYELTRLNIGNAMNIVTGVFTAPVNARYYFSFTAMSWSTDVLNNVYLRLNGVGIGISQAPSYRYNLPLIATLQLKKGDTVDVFLTQGSIYDSAGHHTKFSGFLLEEDLVL